MSTLNLVILMKTYFKKNRNIAKNETEVNKIPEKIPPKVF